MSELSLVMPVAGACIKFILYFTLFIILFAVTAVDMNKHKKVEKTCKSEHCRRNLQ